MNHSHLEDQRVLSGSIQEGKIRATSSRSILRLPLDRINWTTSGFLIGTLALTLTAVPLYLYHFGLDWFQVALFFVMFFACGF